MEEREAETCKETVEISIEIIITMTRIDGEAEAERGKEEARNVTMTMTMIGTETETETTVAEAGTVIERLVKSVRFHIFQCFIDLIYISILWLFFLLLLIV